MAFSKCWHEKLNHCITSAFFSPRDFFLPLQKFKTTKIKLEKNPYIQANTCLLHVSRILKIFSNLCIFFTLIEKVQLSLSIVAVCHVFSADIRSNPISLESIWSYHFLASIPRHYFSVSYRYSVSKMQISGNIFYISSQEIFSWFKTKRLIWPLF